MLIENLNKVARILSTSTTPKYKTWKYFSRGKSKIIYYNIVKIFGSVRNFISQYIIIKNKKFLSQILEVCF